MHMEAEQDRLVKVTYALKPAEKRLIAERLRLSPSAVVARAVHLLAEEEAAEYQVRPIAPEGTDASQAWFWTPEWQEKEREADEDLAAGRTTFHATDEEFLAALDARGPDVANA